MPSSVADLCRGRPEPWQTCVVQTCEEHLRTLILLHGFTESADQYSRWWIRQCRNDPLIGPVMSRTRFVFVQSPTREISCYEDKPQLNAWHDYLTDHGGEGGRPDVEEVIDERHLAECRSRIHRILDDEIALLDGDASRVAIGGQSQGGCTSLDAALTYPRLLGGVFVSFGHLYSVSPAPAAKRELRIWAFHGAADGTIASSLASRSFSRLLDAGFRMACLHVAPLLGHCEASRTEIEFFRRALTDFACFGMSPGGFVAHTSGRRSPPLRGDEPLQKRQALMIRAR